MSHLRWIGSLAIALLTSQSLRAEPATQPAVADQVAALLKQLGSDSYPDREAAVEAASKELPAEALLLLEAAARQPDTSLDVRSELDLVLKAVRARTGKQQHYQAILDFYLGHAGAEYDRVGSKNPAWDVPAKAFLDGYARYAAEQVRDPQPDADIPRFTGQSRTVRCDDPLCTLTPSLVGEGFGQSWIDPHIANLMASNYSSFTKLSVLTWIAGHVQDSPADKKRRAEATDYLNKAIALWPKVLADEPNIPSDVVLHLAKELVDAAKPLGLDRKTAYDKIDAALAQSLPEESLIRLNFKGQFLIDYARDVRGNNPDGLLTDDGEKVSAERLAQADKALSRCYELFPDDARAPTNMIAVELGRGQETDRMQIWFERAMKADPENYAACQFKTSYLAMYGSADAQLAFGRECLAWGVFDTRIPLLVVNVHANYETPGPLVSDVPNAYYAQPEVWNDISAAYDGYLQQHPEEWQRRQWYAYYAWKAGKRELAIAQYAAATHGEGTDDMIAMLRVSKAELAMRPDGKRTPDPTERAIAAARKDTDDFKRLTVDAYDQVGHKDPKWDAAAHAALLAAAKDWGNDPNRDFSEHDVMLEQSKQAIDAGCDDPLVRFIYSHSVDSFVTPAANKLTPTCFEDARTLVKSAYPAFLRLQAMGWAGELMLRHERSDPQRTKLRAALDEALPLLTAATKEHAVRDRTFQIGMSDYLGDYIGLGDTTAGVMQVKKAFEDGGASPLVIQAIDARLRTEGTLLGDSYGNPNYKPTMQDKPVLGTAEVSQLWEPIWQADPSDPYAAEQIQSLSRVARGGRNWTEFWNHEAICSDPHSFAAAEEGYEQLRWVEGITFEDLMSYAQQCAATGDDRSQIPFVLVEDIDNYARQANKSPEDKPDGNIIGDEVYWPMIAGVYEGYLAKFPLDTGRRSEYASYACLAGRWVIAAQQLKILGDRVKRKPFYNRERFDACLKHVKDLADHNFLPPTPDQ